MCVAQIAEFHYELNYVVVKAYATVMSVSLYHNACGVKRRA